MRAMSGCSPVTLQRMRGFTMLEVLVALVILSMGLLGIAALLVTTQKSNSSSYIRQQAVQSAYNILDRIRGNQAEAVLGAYNVSNLAGAGQTPSLPSSPSVDCSQAPCTPAQMASYDTWHWLSRDLAQLTNGCGSVSAVTSGNNTLVTITVQWDDGQASAQLGRIAASPGGTLAQYTVQTML